MDELALLRLQIEWGADEALEESPVDRLHRGTPAVGPAHPRDRADPLPAPAAGQPAAMPVRRGSAAERALAAASAAADLDALRAAIASFDGCALRDTATKPVLAEGDPSARVLLIGDPPGADEDRSGRPFAGADGALLDLMLGSIGLARSELLVAPLIPWRPPGGRPPSPAEVAICLPFLHRLVVLCAPRRAVVMGPLAVRTLLGARQRTGRGWLEIKIQGLEAAVPCLALPSPSMLAKTPGLRREAWAELRRLRRALDGDVART